MIAGPWLVAGGVAAGAVLVRKLRGDRVERAARAVDLAAHDVIYSGPGELRERWARLLTRRLRLGEAVDAADVAIRLPDTRRATPRALELFPTGLVGEVLLIGLTGVGKSTLVNALVGSSVAAVGTGAPVTSGVDRYLAHGRALIVDTEGLELGSRTSHLETLARLADAVWYCIQAESGRVQAAELDLIARLGRVAPVVIVLTRALEPPSDFARSLAGWGAVVVHVLARDRSLGGVVVPAAGIDELIAAHRRVLTSARRLGP